MERDWKHKLVRRLGPAVGGHVEGEVGATTQRDNEETPAHSSAKPQRSCAGYVANVVFGAFAIPSCKFQMAGPAQRRNFGLFGRDSFLEALDANISSAVDANEWRDIVNTKVTDMSYTIIQRAIIDAAVHESPEMEKSSLRWRSSGCIASNFSRDGGN